ncbi:MAG TPA: PilZ domain-containing protein [Candidatus Manganitrophaceae bacterium]|nr:PilZ domain-containing protein [Candidatus Manganitrophaceae bacterium]
MNKRKTKRYLKENCLEIVWKSGGQESTGVAVNLSRKGVDICCQIPPKIGSEISITFQFEDQKKRFAFETVKGKVKWTKKLGLVHTGVEFLSELNQKKHPLISAQIERAQAEEE